MIEKIKKIDRNYWIILIVTVGIFLPYLSTKFMKGDDFICHVSNLLAIDNYISLRDLRLIPSKILPIIARNFGYGSGIFYPPLPYMITTFIYVLVKHIGGTIITAIKIYEFLVIFLSGFFMYKFMCNTFKNKNVAIVSSVMYIFSPYFIYDLFLRMAYGEITVFIFIPIVMMSITYVFDKDYKKFLFYFIIGYTGMILSHLVLTVYFTILLVLVLLINIKKIINKKTIMYFVIGTIIVLGITSGFTLPLIEHKINGNYVVFVNEIMSSLANLKWNRLTLFNVINIKNIVINYNISISAMICIGMMLLYKEDTLEKIKKEKKLYILSIIAFIFFAFLISSEFIDWSKVPDLFRCIQFPWRMATFMAFGFSILGGLGFLCFKDKKFAFLLICIIEMVDLSTIVSKRGVESITIPSFEEVYSSESGAMGWGKEYLPKSTYENIEYFNTREENIIVKNGTVDNVNIIKNDVPYLEFEVNIQEGKEVKVEIPRLFYMGYNIKYKQNDEKIEYYENENGFIEFELNKSGIITVDYEGTNINKIANVISIITTTMFICICFTFIFRNKK